MFSISAAEKESIWNQYLALFKAKQNLPEYWTPKHCTRVLTNLMAGRDFSWHVVGITEKALKQYRSQNFKRLSKDGITRGHIIPRAQTASLVMNAENPLSLEMFFQTWLTNDKTVLCAKGENKKVLPDYISFNNEANLFNCMDRIVGHRHVNEEINFLKSLYIDLYGPINDGHG